MFYYLTSIDTFYRTDFEIYSTLKFGFEVLNVNVDWNKSFPHFFAPPPTLPSPPPLK